MFQKEEVAKLSELKKGILFDTRYLVETIDLSQTSCVLTAREIRSGDSSLVLRFYDSSASIEQVSAIYRELNEQFVEKVIDEVPAHNGFPPYIAFEKGILSLEDWIRNRREADILESRYVISQILQGIAEIHSAGVIHCDLTPSNILLFPDGRWKLANFDSASAKGDPMKDPKTFYYAAPEVLFRSIRQNQHQVCNESQDIWSLGIIVFEILSNGLSFYGECATEDSIKEVLQGTDAMTNHYCLEDREERRFVTQLLSPNPKTRPSAAGTLTDRLFEFVKPDLDKERQRILEENKAKKEQKTSHRKNAGYECSDLDSVEVEIFFTLKDHSRQTCPNIESETLKQEIDDKEVFVLYWSSEYELGVELKKRRGEPLPFEPIEWIRLEFPNEVSIKYYPATGLSTGELCRASASLGLDQFPYRFVKEAAGDSKSSGEVFRVSVFIGVGVDSDSASGRVVEKSKRIWMKIASEKDLSLVQKFKQIFNSDRQNRRRQE